MPKYKIVDTRSETFIVEVEDAWEARKGARIGSGNCISMDHNIEVTEEVETPEPLLPPNYRAGMNSEGI